MAKRPVNVIDALLGTDVARLGNNSTCDDDDDDVEWSFFFSSSTFNDKPSISLSIQARMNRNATPLPQINSIQREIESQEEEIKLKYWPFKKRQN